MSPRLRRILDFIGSFFAVAGTVFVVVRLKSYWGQLDVSGFDAKFWLEITVAVLVYGAAGTLLALAWRNIIAHLGETLSTVWALRVYGISQLAKYVPGNIMHFVGRQAMGQAAGVPGWVLAKSTVFELGLLSFTGLLFSPLLLPHFLPGIGLHIVFLFFGVILCVAVIGIRKLFGVLPAKAFIQHFIFLLQSGIIFVFLLLHFMQDSHISFYSIAFYCGSFVVAWLIGLITPGAPAGLGVREFVLMALLSNSVLEADLLLAVLLSRMVTAVGDFLFFLIVFLFVPKVSKKDVHV